MVPCKTGNVDILIDTPSEALMCSTRSQNNWGGGWGGGSVKLRVQLSVPARQLFTVAADRI